MALNTGDASIMCFDETVMCIFSGSATGTLCVDVTRLRFLLDETALPLAEF